MSLTAVLIAIGDELTSGATVDTNSPWLAHALERLGVFNLRTLVVGDDEARCVDAIRGALAEADVVCVTGGLGPTEDDRTRHAVAEATGRALEHSDEAWTGVVAWYERFRRDIPASNRRQALLPVGAEVLPNAAGTAPGFRVSEGTSELFSLPGPPGEMRAMFDACVRPRVARRAAAVGALVQHRLQMIGLSESVFADEVGAWMDRDANPLVGCTVSRGVLTATLRGRGSDEASAREAVDARAAEMRARFAEWIFRELPHTSEVNPDDSIEGALGAALIERGITVTAAESCTAGLLAAQLARVPGISAVLGAAFVTYSNAAKQELLGVEPETLERHGAVSEEVVRAMARGAAERAGARAAVAISGIAGPGGGTPEKPVGTVAFATSLDGVIRTEIRRLPGGSREAIRRTAANVGLVLLLRRLDEVRDA